MCYHILNVQLLAVIVVSDGHSFHLFSAVQGSCARVREIEHLLVTHQSCSGRQYSVHLFSRHGTLLLADQQQSVATIVLSQTACSAHVTPYTSHDREQLTAVHPFRR